ncbi:MAG TPA: hypothetical protein VIK14_15085, partial [Ignavibacteria bacterium]
MKTLITLLITIITLFIMQKVYPQDKTGFIDKETISTVKQSLIDKYGEKARFRIERGVEQAANLWRES